MTAKQQKHRQLRKGARPVLRRDFLSPMAVLFGLAVLVMTAGIHFAVGTFDRGSERREQTLARNGIAQRINEVALMVVPQTDWDDAVANLDNRFDAEWSRTNIGRFLNQTDGFNRSFVVGHDDRLLAAYANGGVASADTYRAIAPLAAGLIRSVRAQETHRGPIRRVSNGGMVSKPIQASALKLVNGHLDVMVATLVQPDFGTALPAQRRAPIVIATMPVDPAFLKLFADRYLLKGLTVVPLNTRADDSQTGILARDENGKPLASFVWTPLDPGYSMLRELVPPIIGVCVLLMIVGFFQMRRIGSLARSLIEGQEYWRDMASHDASTELPNRLRFVEQLSFEISCLDDDRHSLAIQCIQVGLTPGQIGKSDADIDELAGIAAQRLTRICRQEALVSRLSRDRFGILSIGAGAMEAKALEKRLVAALSAPVSLARGHCDAVVDVATTIVSNNTAEAMAVLMQTEEALGLGAPVLELRPAR